MCGCEAHGKDAPCTCSCLEHAGLRWRQEHPEVEDPVNHPPHYRGPAGVECIQVVEHMNFCRGNAVKYIWRAGSKGDEIHDLEKAVWYLNREIARLKVERAETGDDRSGT